MPFMRPELLPILDLATAGRCGLGFQARTSVPFEAPPSGKVFVTIVSDRLAPRARGPAGFHGVSLTNLFRGAPYIAIVSCGEDGGLYQEAAAIARGGSCAVLIETRPECREGWSAFVEFVAPDRLRNPTHSGTGGTA